MLVRTYLFSNLKTLPILTTGSLVFLPLRARHVIFSRETVDNIRYIGKNNNMCLVLPVTTNTDSWVAEALEDSLEYQSGV